MSTPTLKPAGSFNLDTLSPDVYAYAQLTLAGGSGAAHTTTFDSSLSGDTIVASGSNESLYGGAGNDSLVATGSNTRLIQNLSGHDTLIGNSSTSFLLGSSSLLGNNSLKGTGANGLLIGSAGTLNDSFAGMSGINTVSLTGNSSVTLGGNAAASKVTRVFAGNGDSTIERDAGYTLSAVSLA